MRTTLELADDLGTEIKILAVQENRTLKELISELLRAGLKARQLSQPRVYTLPSPYQLKIPLHQGGLQEILKGRQEEMEVGR